MENCFSMMSAMSGMGSMGIMMWLMMIGFTIITLAFIVGLAIVVTQILRSNRSDDNGTMDTSPRH